MKLAGTWLFFLLLLFALPEAYSQDLTIFDSRRPVSMSSDETTYRDFYINGGIEHGVKKGMILTVSRRLTLYDTYRANSPKEVMLEVGRIKIIFAQKGLSIARQYEHFSRESKAILENDYIMVGDKVDMSSALMESQLKKKSASRSASNKSKISKRMASSSVDFASIAAPSKPKPEASKPSESQENVPLKSLE